MKKLPVLLLAISLVLLVYGCTLDFTTIKHSTTNTITSISTDLSDSGTSTNQTNSPTFPITTDQSTTTTTTTVTTQPSTSIPPTTSQETFSVTWTDDDGTILEVDELVNMNTTPKYDGVTPAKYSTAQYSYQFIGWSPSIAVVTSNQTYKAVYSEILKTYTVTWLNDDQSIITSKEYSYGEVPSLTDISPMKESTSQYDYEFIGWDQSYSVITSNQTYIATYKSIVRNYQVTWKLDNDIILTQSLAYGETPQFNGLTPVKPSTNDHDYQFKGWSPDIIPVTGNQIYTAEFHESIRYYTVLWTDEAFNIISTELYTFGQMPSFTSVIPQKTSDAQFDYHFIGWSPTITPVISNITYQAIFEATPIKYTITWLNDDQTVLATSEVSAGELPVYPYDYPTKKDDLYNYEFISWSKPLLPVVGNETYQAIYAITSERTYTIKFVNYDGTVLDSKEYRQGEFPIVPSMTPYRESDERANYLFDSWSPLISPVTADVSYTATYTESIKRYNIYWAYYTLENKKTLIYYESYLYGSLPVFTGTMPSIVSDDPAYEYVFTGWSPQIESVTGSLSYYAEFEKRLITLTLLFETFGGTAIQSQTLTINSEIESVPEPTRINSTFTGWYLDSTYTSPVSFPYILSSSSSNRTLTFYAKYEVMLDLNVFNEFMAIYMNSINQMRFITLDFFGYGSTGTSYSSVLNQEIQTFYSVSSTDESWTFYGDESYTTYSKKLSLDYIAVSERLFTHIPGQFLENRHFSSSFHGSSPGLVVSFPYYLSDEYGYGYPIFNNNIAIQYNDVDNIYSLFYYSNSSGTEPYVFNYHVDNGLITVIDTIVVKDVYEITSSLEYTTDSYYLIKELPSDGNYRFVKDIEIHFSDGITRWESNTPSVTVEMIEDKHPTLSNNPDFLLSPNQIFTDSDYTIPYDFAQFEDSSELILYVLLI